MSRSTSATSRTDPGDATAAVPGSIVAWGDPGGFGSVLRECPGCALAGLLDAATDLLVVLEVDGLRLRQISHAERARLGLRRTDRIEGLAWSDFASAEDCEHLDHVLSQISGSGRAVWREDTTLRRRDGAAWAVHAFGLRTDGIVDRAGLAVVGAFDRSALAGVVQDLRHEQELLRALFEHFPDAVYFRDRESRYFRTSAAMAAKLEPRGPEAMLGRTDFDYFSGEHARAAFDDELRIMDTGRPIVDFVEKETWPDGRTTWVSSTKLPLRDASGRIVGTFGISRDVTAARAAQDQQRQAELQMQLATKLESIGRLAVGGGPMWELEIAGLLAPIGHVSIPAHVLRKLAARGTLDRDEEAMIQRVPQVGHDLIKDIPRMEGVARMILYQNNHFDGSGLPADYCAGADIPVGARMLKILLDRLALERDDITGYSAQRTLTARTRLHDPRLLAVSFECAPSRLVAMRPGERRPVSISVRELAPGQLLASDILTPTGLTLVGVGNRLSPMMVERLRNLAELGELAEPFFIEDVPLAAG